MIRQKLHHFINRHWYARSWSWFALLMYPCSLIFQWVVTLRRKWLQSQTLKQTTIPVVVVGNISVGGVGKTPFVQTLVERIQNGLHMNCAVITRGYGGKAKAFPFEINAQTDPALTGDEPAMLHRRLGCPVIVDPDRARAIKTIHQNHNDIDVIVSDDGLQHYQMYRDVEIVIVDKRYKFGNRLTLPAGPLREPVSRIADVDFVIANEGKIKEADWCMRMVPECFINIQTRQKCSLNMAFIQPVHAIAGIGQPDKLFNALKRLGVPFTAHSFPDHYAYQQSDLDKLKANTIIMTEKDAVKCCHFHHDNMYYLAINAHIEEGFWSEFVEVLASRQS